MTENHEDVTVTADRINSESYNDGDLGDLPQVRRRPARKSTFKLAVTGLYRKAKRPSQQGGHRVDIAFILLAAVVYGVLFFGLGTAFLPGHAAWDTLLLWASAIVGSLVAYYLYLPNVIGMLAAGIMLRNIPWNAINAFPSAWGNQMRAAALATIFLRCGLELDFGTMRRFKGPATKLALIPGLCEAFYDGGIASVIFSMPILLGFTLGFILKAVGPGLVVPAMFRLQKIGLGRDQGIPSTVVISASFDDIVAITGFSIFSSIAIQTNDNTAWNIAKGPMQVVFGILGGIIFGVALGCTKVFNTKLKRLVGIYGSCLLIMFFLGHWDMKAGGALGSLVVGLIASNAWEKGFPRFASLGPAYEYSPAIERWMALIWVWVMEPILFVTIGASIHFETLDSGTIPKALIIIFSGLGVRLLMTYLAMWEYPWRERTFYAVAWTPKATVQAALSATPLTMIQSAMSPSDPDYDEWIAWGNDILTTGIFAIIVCGTLGVLAIHFTAPLLLRPSEEGGAADNGHPRSPPGSHKPPPEAFNGPGGQPTAIDAVGVGVQHELARVPSAGLVLRPSSAQSTRAAHDRASEEEDYELIAEFIDAIRHLTVAARAEHPNKEEVRRLSNMVMTIQKRIETEVGRREPSVREMFRTASALAAQRPLGPPITHLAPSASGQLYYQQQYPQQYHSPHKRAAAAAAAAVPGPGAATGPLASGVITAGGPRAGSAQQAQQQQAQQAAQQGAARQQGEGGTVGRQQQQQQQEEGQQGKKGAAE